MTQPIQYVAVLAFAALLMTGCQATNGSLAGQALEDRTITAEVKSRLASLEPDGTLTQIEVKTIESTVYLIGQVPTQKEKAEAEDIASHVTGVRRVVSHLTIRQASTS